MTSNEPDFEMIADALNDLATAQENGSLSAAGQYPAAAIRDEIATLEAWMDRDALKPKEIWLGNGDSLHPVSDGRVNCENFFEAGARR